MHDAKWPYVATTTGVGKTYRGDDSGGPLNGSPMASYGSLNLHCGVVRKTALENGVF